METKMNVKELILQRDFLLKRRGEMLEMGRVMQSKGDEMGAIVARVAYEASETALTSIEKELLDLKTALTEKIEKIKIAKVLVQVLIMRLENILPTEEETIRELIFHLEDAMKRLEILL